MPSPESTKGKIFLNNQCHKGALYRFAQSRNVGKLTFFKAWFRPQVITINTKKKESCRYFSVWELWLQSKPGCTLRQARMNTARILFATVAFYHCDYGATIYLSHSKTLGMFSGVTKSPDFKEEDIGVNECFQARRVQHSAVGS